MPKKKSKPKTHKPQKTAPAPKAKPKASAKAKSGPTTEVEARWNEYWTQRKSLEDAVGRVREAREALEAALDAERTLRSTFDETKRTLKTLLDVAPADSAGGATGELPVDGFN